MNKPLCLAASFLFSAAAIAQAQQPTPPRPANEQVVVPQVERREVKLPRYPSKDIEASVFAGVYSVENFGANAVYGLRLGYHITEDFFVQANMAQTKVSDESYRALLPGGGIFPQPSEKLNYYNITAGWNVLPGEVFFGKGRALATSVYLLGGVGSTKLAERRRTTLNFGLGLRALFGDRFAAHVEMRDHVFSIDLLGPNQSTHNLELTTGVAWFF